MKTVQSYKTPNLTIVNGQVKTTSVAIAELFSKNHKDVLRAIDNLECSIEFAGRNFAPSSYRGLDNAEARCFDITRDGMVFLIMGFTGQNAARFKEAYIMAFNKMEAELSRLQSLTTKHETKVTKSQGIDLVKQNVLKIIAKAGVDGISESRLTQSCVGFERLISEQQNQVISSLPVFIKFNESCKGGRKGRKFFIR